MGPEDQAMCLRAQGPPGFSGNSTVLQRHSFSWCPEIPAENARSVFTTRFLGS